MKDWLTFLGTEKYQSKTMKLEVTSNTSSSFQKRKWQTKEGNEQKDQLKMKRNSGAERFKKYQDIRTILMYLRKL